MPKFTTLGVSNRPLFLERVKIRPFYGQNMVLTWSSNCFSLNYNQSAQGGSMSIFTILVVSYGPLSLKMAKIWPFYVQNMVLI